MKKHWGLLLVLILSLGLIRPLLQPGFFPIHDQTQVVRVQQMSQALKAGQFPVRWVSDLGYGYGYPLFNFYAPLVYYLGALFNFFLDALSATKLMMILGIVLAGVGMYLLGREFWGKAGGLIASLFYLYAPYHAVDIYVRGAVGEFWAMAFLPLIFYGLARLWRKKKFGLIITSLSLAALILSHNLTAMMVFPLVLFLALLVKDKRRSLLAVFWALTLAAFYWLPALAEMSLTKVLGQIGGGADWQDHFVFLDQLWASPWGFGGSAPGRLDGMSFMIGKIQLLFVFLSLITFIFRKRKRKILLIGLLVFILAVFLTNQASQFIWQSISILAFIQYPWRFLVLATFTASFLAGSIALWFEERTERIWLGSIIIILALLLLNLKYFQPQFLLDVSNRDLINKENIKWATSKISAEYLPQDFPVPETKDEVAWEKVVIIEGEGEIKDPVLKPHQYTFGLEAKTETKVLVNLAYFPGWQVKGADFEVEEGKIKLFLPAGEHQISIALKNTPVRTIANLISLVSLGGMVVFMLKFIYRK